jgi:hypothetical protein
VQNIESEVGHYILSDRPMSEDEWIAQRAVVEQKRLPKPIAPGVTQATDASEEDKPDQ